MGMGVHLIPTNEGFAREPLFEEMIQRGVKVQLPHDFRVLEPEDAVMGFCNAEFLDKLPEIRKHTKRTVFLNCMSWLFEKEKECMSRGEIAMFLYQNGEVRQKHMPQLRVLNPAADARFLTFKPYFEASLFPFVAERSTEFFGCGRISRQDTDKFAANTLHIYESFLSPLPKKGLFLGFDLRSEAKIGRPFDWIRTAADQTEVSQGEFYRHCEIVLQPTDTTENWPRVGFEAMASGSVLIVDNRGGWRQMVKHGETGWICDHERDFIYYASKMAYEPELRRDMAERARKHGMELGGLQASMESWAAVFAEIDRLPT
jgi:hypothetical protein